MKKVSSAYEMRECFYLHAAAAAAASSATNSLEVRSKRIDILHFAWYGSFFVLLLNFRQKLFLAHIFSLFSLSSRFEGWYWSNIYHPMYLRQISTMAIQKGYYPRLASKCIFVCNFIKQSCELYYKRDREPHERKKRAINSGARAWYV